MSEPESIGSDSSGSGLELNRLVTECLERFEREGITAIDAICAQNPALEAKLRRRVGMLRAMGLLSDQSPATNDAIPERLGDFRLLRRLGAGGMGVVFLAEQMSLKRRVALKLIRPEHLYFPGAKERFRREAEAVARLTHPGIVPIHVVGEEKGLPYYAMDVVEGCSLTQVLERVRGSDPAALTGADFAQAVGELSLASAADVRLDAFGHSWTEACLRIVAQVAQALAHAHDRGVLHRDLKPSNVMVTPDGRALLLDFGLACVTGETKLTKSGSQLGSLTYMPPEACWQDGTVDARSDVYSLAVTLYELLTLVAPFQGSDIARLQTAIVGGSYQPVRSRNSAVTWDAETVCQKAMDCEPPRRYASADAFHADLRAVLELRPIAAARPSVTHRVRRFAKRHPARALAALFLVLGLVAGPWTYAVIQRRTNERLREEQQRTAEQRARAEDSLQIALDAVERLQFRFGSDLLQDVPGAERLRDELLGEALQLYAKVAEHATDDARLRLSRARTERRRAHTLAQLGSHDEAVAALERADAMLAARFEDGGEERKAQFERASVQFEFGAIAIQRGRKPEAIPLLERARAGISTLAHGADGTFEEGALLARTLDNLALAYGDAGRSDDAIAAANEAVALLEEWDVQDDARVDVDVILGSILCNIGALYTSIGRTEEGLGALRHARDVAAKRLSERPHVVALRIASASLECNYGYELYTNDTDAARHVPEAQQHVERGLEQFESLAADYPNSPSYAFNAAQIRNMLAEILMYREQLDAADALLAKNDAVLLQLEERTPDKQQVQRRRASVASIRASIKETQGKSDEAVAESRRCLALLDPFGVPTSDVDLIERLRAIAHESVASWQLEQGDARAALVEMDAALTALAHVRAVNALDPRLPADEHEAQMRRVSVLIEVAKQALADGDANGSIDACDAALAAVATDAARVADADDLRARDGERLARVQRIEALIALRRHDELGAEIDRTLAVADESWRHNTFRADVWLRALRQGLADGVDSSEIATMTTRAIDALGLAVQTGELPVEALRTEADCDPIRADPRFKALVDEE